MMRSLVNERSGRLESANETWLESCGLRLRKAHSSPHSVARASGFGHQNLLRQQGYMEFALRHSRARKVPAPNSGAFRFRPPFTGLFFFSRETGPS
jgi:hypothetical protein